MRVLRLPLAPGVTKADLDEFTLAHGSARLQRLIDAAPSLNAYHRSLPQGLLKQAHLPSPGLCCFKGRISVTPLHTIDRAASPPTQLDWPQIADQLRADLHSERIILLPVRAFIGLGWLRAGVEKLIDPQWLDGASLHTFLSGQLTENRVAFPFYEALIQSLFLPQAQILSWIVLIGQLLAGLAILAGCFTSAALVGGLFMNLNFLLAGEPNPSAFYLVIQMALLLTNTGAILGIDVCLGRVRQLAWLTARPPTMPAPTHCRSWMRLSITLLCVISAGSTAVFIRDFSPAGSVHDSAMILTILAAMAATWAGLSYLRSIIPPSENGVYPRP